jgi:hypothetical protein
MQGLGFTFAINNFGNSFAALRRLREDNLVSSRQGAGTVVVPRPSADSYVHDVMSINDLVAWSVGKRFEIETMEMLVLDEKLATREFLQGVYGKAAAPIARYIKMMHDRVQKDGIHCHIFDSPYKPHLSPEMIERASKLFDAAERLARVVCADRSMVDDAGITAIATHVADAQVGAIATAINQVRARHPSLRCAAVLGLGAPIATTAAREAGLIPVPMDATWTAATSRVAPAVAVARLLEAQRG